MHSILVMKTKRGPKPKPHAPCESCGFVCSLKRNHCERCYARLLRNGSLCKLPKFALPIDLTEEQMQIMTGSLLGDGSLYRRKPTHMPYYVIQRCLGDKEYAKWHNDVFSSLVSRFQEGSTHDPRTNQVYSWVKLVTRRAEVFVSVYEKWYVTGEKQVPDDIKLSDLSLAVWFADDGHVRSVGSPWRLQLKMATHGFSIRSVELLCSLLVRRYNEYFGITLEGHEKKPIIYGSDSAARVFLKEIDKVLPASMDRKAYWRKPDVRFYEEEPARGRPSAYLRKTTEGTRNEENQISKDFQPSLVRVQ
jgi:hypothetical protein